MLQESPEHEVKYADTMQGENTGEFAENQADEEMMPVQPYVYVNTSLQNPVYRGGASETECNEATPQTFQIPPGSEELLPVRMTEKSIYYCPAFRLDESNVCAEVRFFFTSDWDKKEWKKRVIAIFRSFQAVEAILFDSLEGELILAEYQQNNFLSSTTQQKLTDVLLSRSAKSMTAYDFFFTFRLSCLKWLSNSF